MPFSPLCTLQITENWQLTPITTANYFRLQYSANFGFGNVILAQAQVSQNGLELLGTFRFSLKGQAADIAQLEVPQIFDPALRCLAIRGIGPRNQPGKILTLTIEAQTMNIVNPSGSNTSGTVKTELKQDVATALEVLVANTSRNGGTVINKGTKKLYLSFGGAVDKSSPLVVLPGGNADIQANFTGSVSAIWDAIDATVGNSSKAIFIEFVA
jgi:hypothetical protein